MIADRAISKKLDDTVHFTRIEELSRLIMGGEMLFHCSLQRAVFSEEAVSPQKISKTSKMKPNIMKHEMTKDNRDIYNVSKRSLIISQMTDCIKGLVHTKMYSPLSCSKLL